MSGPFDWNTKQSAEPNPVSVQPTINHQLVVNSCFGSAKSGNMDREYAKVHIMFLPFPGHGHMIPMADMARVFGARGVRATIVTTPVNAPSISRTIGTTSTGNGKESEINIRTIKFPCAEAGLPEGCENTELIPSPDMFLTFFKATAMLQGPLEHLLLELHPDCLVAGAFFPWATDSAAKFKIPRLVFHGTGVFSLCASECVRLYQPHKNVSSDSQPFLIPHLPGDIKITRMVLPEYLVKSSETETETELARVAKAVKESEVTSFGVVVNSFYELEQVYADYYTKVQGRKAWYIGPLSLCNKDSQEKAHRGKQASIDEEVIMKWLHSKKPNTVVYVCFGSIANFPETQLKQIATGLEASGQQFIWVVRRKSSDKEKEEWLPEGFETRVEGRGLIIRGWAPQVLILDHEAVGGFVTHCGWNSTLEAVSAGVPMVTWPVSAEQFYNEKLVTELLGIGVPVGVKKWARVVGDSITSDAVHKAVNRIMVGVEAEAMRNRAQTLAQMARRAVQEQGSSYSHLTSLLQHLGSYCMS